MEHVNYVIKRIANAYLRIDTKKCSFASKEVELLGHFITFESIQVDLRKTDLISNAPIPTTITELRSFIGLEWYCETLTLLIKEDS